MVFIFLHLCMCFSKNEGQYIFVPCGALRIKVCRLKVWWWKICAYVLTPEGSVLFLPQSHAPKYSHCAPLFMKVRGWNLASRQSSIRYLNSSVVIVCIEDDPGTRGVHGPVRLGFYRKPLPNHICRFGSVSTY